MCSFTSNRLAVTRKLIAFLHLQLGFSYLFRKTNLHFAAAGIFMEHIWLIFVVTGRTYSVVWKNDWKGTSTTRSVK